MRPKGFQPHHGYLSQRIIHGPISTSPSASNKNIHASFQSITKQSREQRAVLEEIKVIHQQNFVLKEQNRVLKRELQYLRNEGMLRIHEHQDKKEINDLRSTIKKQAGQIQDLKTRIDMLSKQCKVYEDIIDKMESKITRLLQEKTKLEDSVHTFKTQEKMEKYKKKNEGEKESSMKLGEMTKKVGEALKKIVELEQRMKKENEEWVEWKKQWSRQKIYYLGRIQELQKSNWIKKEPEQTEKFMKMG